MSRRVLIAGCGYVGCALGERLAARGDRVWGIRRNTARLPRLIEPIRADLANPDSLRALPGPFDVAFYTAGAAEYSDAAYRAAYRDGLGNLLDALDACGGAKRMIFTSSTAVYAQDDGSEVDEESPTEPRSFSGAHVLEGERLLQSRHAGSIAVRLGGIYGPGRTGLIDRVRSGAARREPEPSHYLNLIHLDDIVGVLEHLAHLDNPEQVYVGVDNEPQHYNALLEWIAGQLGVPAPPVTTQPQTRGRPVRNRRCSNVRLRGSGYRFAYPDARAGYAALL